jgi:hypothetical protein
VSQPAKDARMVGGVIFHPLCLAPSKSGEPSLIYGYETTSIAEKRQRSRIRSCGVFGNEFS